MLATRDVRLSDSDIKRLYENSFSKRERVSFLSLLLKAGTVNSRFLRFSGDETGCGMCWLKQYSGTVYVLYLAAEHIDGARSAEDAILETVGSMYPGSSIAVLYRNSGRTSGDILNSPGSRAFYIDRGFLHTGFRIELFGRNTEVVVDSDEIVSTGSMPDVPVLWCLYRFRGER